jgi:hypothetical protein
MSRRVFVPAWPDLPSLRHTVKSLQMLLPLQRLTLSIKGMYVYRKISSLVLLLALSVSTTNLEILAQAWFSAKPKTKEVSCPVHATQCRCPHSCSVPVKPKPKTSCHDPAGTAQEKPASNLSSASCLWKAGCGGKDIFSGFASGLKEFLPRYPNNFGLDENVSLLIPSFHFSALPGYSRQLFHPPRNS